MLVLGSCGMDSAFSTVSWIAGEGLPLRRPFGASVGTTYFFKLVQVILFNGDIGSCFGFLWGRLWHFRQFFLLIGERGVGCWKDGGVGCSYVVICGHISPYTPKV